MAHSPKSIINNRYRIVRVLGQGDFGAVYEAWDVNLNKSCALKETLDTSEEAQRHFKHEAMTLAKLSHPNLPRVTDHFVVPGQAQYLVMDFVDGEDLATLLEREGAVAEKQALEWVGQVADALIYLHSQPLPVIHRDIKPANIRLTPDGRVVLVDFGIMKVYDERSVMGAYPVTAGYSAPEQYDHRNTDARTDVYGLGATLYTLLTKLVPQESIERIKNDYQFQANDANQLVSSRVSKAIERAMALNPEKRYQTVAEFKAALGLSNASSSVMSANQATEQPKSSAGQTLLKIFGFLGASIVAVFLLCCVILIFIPSSDEASLDAPESPEAWATARTLPPAEFTNLVEANKTLVVGPKEGRLVHDADNGITSEQLGVDVKDFIIEATFTNPYSAETGAWDVGFLFRNEGGNQQLRLAIGEDKEWSLHTLTTAEPEFLDQGRIGSLDVSANGTNHVKLICHENLGLLYINDQFIAELDLSKRLNSGDLLIATGIFNNHTIEGEVTTYEDLNLWSIP